MHRARARCTFERNLARLFEREETPRLSGVQIKAPMHLDQAGRLHPSTDSPFTHILKPAGTSGFEALPLIEWLTLALAEACGFDVPARALVEMPDGLPPALVVQRFDIREGSNDTRMLALEDFCSVLGLPTEAKYDGTIERIARSVRPLSTAPGNDIAIIFGRALFAWLIADGDMHLKNMALLKIAEPDEQTFHTVRLAPVYDAVTTRVFPNLAHDRIAFKLNGKDEGLRRADFKSLAATARLNAGVADELMDRLIGLMTQAVGSVTLPALSSYGPRGKETTGHVLEIVRNRLASFS